jgi:hypothetical protein
VLMTDLKFHDHMRVYGSNRSMLRITIRRHLKPQSFAQNELHDHLNFMQNPRSSELKRNLVLIPMRHTRNSVNINLGDPQDRRMTTGLHTVRDIQCGKCKAILGWKYVSRGEFSSQGQAS